ncbi:MAG: Pr6Pr family membrane protein [Chitinophagaceae bacterium]|nr:Pr6Pr family membrane protein [Chitinophagaceae bacterium]MBP8243957.1 Pr6Pr family membrane protein [Chitinophagaceae bacterium]
MLSKQKYLARIILAAISWFALILQFRIMINSGAVTGLSRPMLAANFFSYFTILSNLLVAVSISFQLNFPKSKQGQFFSSSSVSTAIAVYIFIVGLVYNLVLRGIWSPTGWQLVADNLLHVAVPLLYILYWYFFSSPEKLPWKSLLSWLVFPAFYLTYTLIRGALVNWYPYPFVDAGNLGYVKVALNSLAVLAAILITGSVLLTINNRIKVKQS